MIKNHYILLFLVLTVGFNQAQLKGTENVKAELISEVKSIQPGEKFWVAVRLDMADEWHTYWRNPGDAGIPTEIEWTLPENFSVSEIHWPWPVLFETSGVVSYGYKNKVLLLSEITPPAEISNDKLSINADVNWLECKELCLPGGAELSLTLPVGSEQELNEQWIDSFRDAREMHPVVSKTWEFSSAGTDSSIIIQIVMPEQERINHKKLRFLPYDEGIYNNSKEQNIKINDRGIVLEVMFADFKLKYPDNVRGIIKFEEPVKSVVQAVEIMVPLTK